MVLSLRGRTSTHKGTPCQADQSLSLADSRLSHANPSVLSENSRLSLADQNSRLSYLITRRTDLMVPEGLAAIVAAFCLSLAAIVAAQG